MADKSNGKTCLMKALLHLKDPRNPIVERLLEISESRGDVKEFVQAAYTSDDYKGQTALHIAIERRSIFYVKLLISKGADVHAKACGNFFQPRKGPYFYFGELPLSLAACTNQAEVVDLLMDSRADPKMTDSRGNTVLHALVMISDKSEENVKFIAGMYDHILKTTARLYPKVNLEEMKNKKGLTPFTMAAKIGKVGLFSHILRREFQESDIKHLSRKFTEWVYGPVQCSLYDLALVDSCEDDSVTEILVYGTGIPNRHEMLDTEPLCRLLQEKWKKFAGGMFLLNFLFYLVYLMIFTAWAYNKKGVLYRYGVEPTIEVWLNLSGQVYTLLANIYFFIMGLIDLSTKRPKMKTLLIDGYYDILFFVQGLLFLASAVLYIQHYEEFLGPLVLCLALSWVNVLYFSRGNKHMGIYSIMIQKMILSDILRFLFVYIVFLFGFSAAVVTLLIEPTAEMETNPYPEKTRLFGPLSPDETCVKPTYANISYTTLQLFKFTIGMGDMEFTNHYKYKEVFYILLISYIILTYILLLNMLIALMNRTVENISKESTTIWKLQRAVTILDMEKRLPRWLRKKFRCGVKKNINTALGEDPRWCFRVEEVNWGKWNVNQGKIDEEPGRDSSLQSSTDTRSQWKILGRSLRSRFTQGGKRRQTHQSTEMSPLNDTSV